MKSYECGNCGANLDPSGHSATMRCQFCGTVSEKCESHATTLSHWERDAAPREAKIEEPRPKERTHGSTPPRGEKRQKKERKDKDWFMRMFVGGIVMVLAGAFGYEYLIPKRTAVGSPLIADVNGDGVEDLITQWDEDVHGGQSARIGLIDGKSRQVVWSHAFSQKKYSNPIVMALGDGFLLVGDPKPIATLMDPMTGAVTHTIDLPDPASQAFANGQSGWLDMNGKYMRVDARTGQGTRMKDSILDPERPAWAPYDANQTCPRATCRGSAPMPIADMNVHEVYLNGTSDDAVAIGQKENGTHLPMLAGISLATKKTRWSRVLTTQDAATPQHPVIAHERIYFEYTDGARRHLACASVATGEIVWDVATDEHASRSSAITVGANVYVRREGTIEVHAPATGAIAATLP